MSREEPGQLVEIVCERPSLTEKKSSLTLPSTTPFAFIYQNIGSAVLGPLWMIILFKNSGPNTYFHSGRAVPVTYARLILPAVLILYFIPTVAIFVPGQSITSIQSVLAFWQVTPILVNVPFWFASFFISSKPATGAAKNADIPDLKILYNVLLIINIITHFIAVYKVAASENPIVSFQRVFIPDPAFWKTSMAEGIHWMFQWDWILDALVLIIPSIVAIFDVMRLIPDIDDDSRSDKIFKAVYGTLALTVLGGPAAAMAGIWGWREEQMVVMEERAEKEKAKKGL